jgi:Putative adhesin
MYGTATSATAPNGSGPDATAGLPLTHGRRVALAIGVPLCAVAIGWTGLNVLAPFGTGNFAVNYAIPASASKLAVNLDGGSISVRAATSGRGSLTGVVHYSLVRPTVTESGSGTAEFGLHCPDLAGIADCGLNVTASVPKRMPLSVSTGGGSVTAVGLTGVASLSTSGGDITAADVAGPLTVSSGGGSIQATGVTAANVSAQTAGGDVDITFTKVPLNVQVETGGGNITIILPRGNTHYHVTASSGGGNASYPTIPLDTSSPNVITANTAGGNISIEEGP